jgi:hypothetical protein
LIEFYLWNSKPQKTDCQVKFRDFSTQKKVYLNWFSKEKVVKSTRLYSLLPREASGQAVIYVHPWWRERSGVDIGMNIEAVDCLARPAV